MAKKDYDFIDEILWENRDKVKKLIRLKKKGTNFAERIGVPFDRLTQYKRVIKTDLSFHQEGRDVMSCYREFSWRVAQELKDPEKYKDLPPAEFNSDVDRSQLTQEIERLAAQDTEVALSSLKLTRNQLLFCVNYVATLDAKKSAIAAGYQTTRPCNLLLVPKIKQAIAIMLAKPLKDSEITPENVLRDIQMIRDRAMQAHPVKDSYGHYLGEWTYDPRSALKALEMMGQYLGLFKVKHEHTGEGGGPIRHKIEYTYDMSQLTDEELRYFQERIKPKLKVIEAKVENKRITDAN